MCTCSPTYDTFGKRGSLQRGQPQVSYLHRACGPRDEDVVTFQVSVNDGWSSGVQEVEAFEDLSAPRAQNLDFHDLKTLEVPVGERNPTKGHMLRQKNGKQISSSQHVASLNVQCPSAKETSTITKPFLYYEPDV